MPQLSYLIQIAGQPVMILVPVKVRFTTRSPERWSAIKCSNVFRPKICKPVCKTYRLARNSRIASGTSYCLTVG
jgi:hypothetical protein